MANSMVHWNGCHLVAIDVETTGLDPNFHEIVQIAVLPLDSNIKPRTDVLPFYIMIKPEYPERFSKEAQSVNKLKLSDIMERGFDKFAAIDLFEEWMDKIGLPYNASGHNRCNLIPLAQNWPFDREFVAAWLGRETFHLHFHPRYRDTMTVANFINDNMGMQGEDVPYHKVNLTWLCKKLNIRIDRAHDALSDCAATAAVYREFVRRRMIF